MTLLGGGGTALDEAGKRPTAAKFRPGMRWDCSWGRKARRRRSARPDGAQLKQEGAHPWREGAACAYTNTCPPSGFTHSHIGTYAVVFSLD